MRSSVGTALALRPGVAVPVRVVVVVARIRRHRVLLLRLLGVLRARLAGLLPDFLSRLALLPTRVAGRLRLHLVALLVRAFTPVARVLVRRASIVPRVVPRVLLRVVSIVSRLVAGVAPVLAIL